MGWIFGPETSRASPERGTNFRGSELTAGSTGWWDQSHGREMSFA